MNLMRMSRLLIPVDDKTNPSQLQEVAFRQGQKLKFEISPWYLWLEFDWRVSNFCRSPFKLNRFNESIVLGLVQAGIIDGTSLYIIRSPIICHYSRPSTELEYVEVRLANYPLFQGKRFSEYNPTLFDEIIEVRHV